MISTYATPFEQAADFLPARIREQLHKLSDMERKQAHELRLRIGKPFSVSFAVKQAVPVPGLIVTPCDIEECFKQVCEYSVHAYARELSQGFITVRGGHRVGICGTAVTKGGEVENIKDISGMNIRIARQVLGSADEIVALMNRQGLLSVLLAGAPASGKTTILRDLCRQLGNQFKLSVIDERGELAACCRGTPQNDIGQYSDVFDGYPKSSGIMTALRAMSPQAIVCDEIGGEEDCVSLRTGLYAGAKLLATAHADSAEDLCRRPHIARLIQEGAFDYIVLLRGGKIARVIKAEDLLHHDTEAYRRRGNRDDGPSERDPYVIEAEGARFRA